MEGICRDCNTVPPSVEDEIASKLRSASRNGHQGCIRALLDSGADVNADCFLVESASGGHLECLQLLLSAGADINRWHNDRGVTALHAAAEQGQESTLEELLRLGADVNARDRDFQKTPLIYARQSNRLSCAGILFHAGADPNVWDYKKDNPLFRAVSFNQSETVKTLIEAGADVNLGDRYGHNVALFIAVKKGAVESLKLLLKAGADVNGYATGAGVNKLDVNSGDDVRDANEDEERAVNTRADVNKSGVMSSRDGVRDANEDVERTVNNVKKMRHDDVNSTSTYEEGGVNDVNTEETITKSDDDENVSDLCGSDSDESSEDIPHPLLIRAIMDQQCECAIVLIEAGADVNIFYLWTPLVLASELGYADVVKALIQSGADVNEVNMAEGGSAIYEAVRGGYYACAELLTAAGADVNAQKEGLTPLFVSSALMLDVRFTKLLLRAGARVNEPIIREKVKPMTHPDTREVVQLLFAAGETLDGTTGELWIPFCRETLKEMNLKIFCRNEIRRCLIARDRHTHLFGRIPLLKLPKQIESFLLYELSLEDNE